MTENKSAQPDAVAADFAQPTDPSAPSALTEAVHARIDELFAQHEQVFGRDLAPYTGHAHRVAGLTMAQVQMQPEWVEAVAVASFFHDAAIWFEHTWDYLPGSESLALKELAASGHEQDAELVTAMIDEHHRVRRARNPHPLVEAMRQADAADIYRAKMPTGVERSEYKAMMSRFPDAGMHMMLARGFVLGLKERKRINPMPMVKL